jgi:RNA polymerase sigma factor (sigma-70 family)
MKSRGGGSVFMLGERKCGCRHPSGTLPMPAVDHDMALLDRYVRLHDEEAFAAIVKRYAGMVYHTTLRVLGDTARAEEVAQETFFQLVKRGDTVHQSLAGWLHRTATRLAIDTLRSDVARQARESSYHKVHPKEVDRWQELSPYIDEALAAMPDEARDLLVKHFLEGRTQSQLAMEMKLSRPTINRRIRAALEELRVRLGKMGVMAAVTVVFLSCRSVSHAATASAPLTLTAELGKMSLISGSVAGSAAGTAPGIGGTISGGAAWWWDVWVALRGLLPATAGTCIVAAATAGVIFTIVQMRTSNDNAGNADPPPPPITVVVPDTAEHEKPKTNSGNESMRCIMVAGDNADLSSNRVVIFQHPDTATDGQLMVAFGDSHVAFLPVEDVEALVEKQTGRTFATFVAESDVIELDEVMGNMHDGPSSVKKDAASSGKP